MIVRLQGEGQFELPDSAQTELERLDGELFQAIGDNDNDRFEDAVSKIEQFVRTQGKEVPTDTLVGSDIILPAPDTTLDEARRILTDEGFLTPVEA